MILLIAAIIALVLAAIELYNARGRSFVSWAVVILAIGIILANSGLLDK